MIALAVVWLSSGCALFESRPKEDATSVSAAELGAGYALLYDFVSREKQVSMLSYIKKETPQLEALLDRIADTSKATAKELEALAKASPALDLKATHLPRMERAARQSIEKETSNEIMHSKGVALELKMVSSQLSGLNYAAHLARSLALVETIPARKAFLRRTDVKFTELHAQVYKMLSVRYER